MAGATKVIRLELPVDAVDPAAAAPEIKGGQEAIGTASATTDGPYSIGTPVYFEDATVTSTPFRLLQTKGYFARHRPCYMIE